MPKPIADAAAATFVLGIMPDVARPGPIAEDCEIVEHRSMGGHHMRLTIEAPYVADVALAGQFLMLSMSSLGSGSPVLPRPMAVYSVDRDRGLVDVVYGVVGEGTRRLAALPAGTLLQVIGPLGRPFTVPEGTTRVLLVGRGIGTCSLTTVAERLPAGVALSAVTSARTDELLIGAELYRAHGAEHVMTVTDAAGDSAVGSLGDRLRAELDEHPPEVIMTCGSNRLAAMCHELAGAWGSEVQVSIEAHMACGLGYCHGCASGQRSEGAESPLVCKDGPVFLLQDAPG